MRKETRDWFLRVPPSEIYIVMAGEEQMSNEEPLNSDHAITLADLIDYIADTNRFSEN